MWARGTSEYIARTEHQPRYPKLPRSHPPLQLAAYNGCAGVKKLLLGQNDIDPNRPDNESRTPLSWAAQHGHQALVKYYSDKTSTPTSQMSAAAHNFQGPPGIGTREWSNYCPNGTTLTPPSWTGTAKHHLPMPLEMATKDNSIVS